MHRSKFFSVTYVSPHTNNLNCIKPFPRNGVSQMDRNDGIDRAAAELDRKYGDVDNFAYQTGATREFNHALFEMRKHGYYGAAETVESLFGAAHAFFDEDGNGRVEFAELAEHLKSPGSTSHGAPLTEADLRKELFKAMAPLGLQMQMKAWQGWEGDDKRDDTNPFLRPLQAGVDVLLREAEKHK